VQTLKAKRVYVLMRVPRIIHQTWKTSEIPERVKKYQESVLRHHPNWSYILWTDKDIERYIRERHAWLYDFFYAMTTPICRIDLVRYLWLYDFGGVYLDLDVQCFRPLDALLDSLPDDAETALAREPVLHELAMKIKRGRVLQPTDQCIGNAVMVSKASARFWPLVVNAIVEKGTKCENAIWQTGPLLLGDVLKKNHEGDSTLCALVPSRCFYPFEGVLTKLRSAARKIEDSLAADPRVFTAHHFTNSWTQYSEMDAKGTPAAKRASLKRATIAAGGVTVVLALIVLIVVAFVLIFRRK
jgi:hypothetical protein